MELCTVLAILKIAFQVEAAATSAAEEADSRRMSTTILLFFIRNWKGLVWNGAAVENF